MGKWPVEALLSSELPPWVTEAYLIPQSILQVQLRWCSSKWIHLKSEGLGGSIPQFFPGIRYGVHWMWNWISWHGHQLDEKVLRQRQSGARSWKLGLRQCMAVGGADLCLQSCVLHFMCVHHCQLVPVSPLPMEVFMILSLFSESPNFRRMCLHIYF